MRESLLARPEVLINERMYVYPDSSASGTPCSRMNRLFGTQMTPPETTLAPPTVEFFSMTSDAWPSALTVSPAQRPPAPLPTMTTSVSKSQTSEPASVVASRSPATTAESSECQPHYPMRRRISSRL
jgi:hypothetical protein